MPEPTRRPARRPSADDHRPQVRHGTTGDLGTLHRVDPDQWQDWALVRWDVDGPGMRDQHGLSRVAPRLLEKVGA